MTTDQTTSSAILLKEGIAELTQQEYRVLQLTVQGYTCKEAANQLGVSASTISKHRKNIIKKLNLRGKVAFRRVMRLIKRLLD